ncbi:MAG: hypothetical protein HYY16_09190 [Planctomycetes bacterium]|nr:hypothetical protein [Planctomycetota bacterium]
MPPLPLEDLLQLAFKRLERLLGLVSGGAREHAELTASTVYAAATNSFSFGAPKRHLRIFAEEDAYWIDSAADDADAAAKLAAAGGRGFVRGGDRLEISLAEGITRLDFLARETAGGIFITGLD